MKVTSREGKTKVKVRPRKGQDNVKGGSMECQGRGKAWSRFVKGDLRLEAGYLRMVKLKLVIERCELRIDNQDLRIPSCYTLSRITRFLRTC